MENSETQQQPAKKTSRRRRRTRQVDVEVEALQIVYSALKPLTPEQRAKVNSGVNAMLGGQ